MKSKDIILIDKPKGITSFDVIRRLRKKYGVKKMGHSGTLDPLATGLMIVGIGKGTKKLTQLIGLPKVYDAQILLGIKTSTGDMEGKILQEKKIDNLDKEKIKKTLNKLQGKLTIPAPIYSAIKVSGQPLYKRARKGEDVKPPEREMEIFWIKFKKLFKKNSHFILKMELKVKSGTYVRSIAEEIGRQLNLPATLSGLRRLEIGEFSVKHAIQP